jgi:hypothetical protein
MKHLWEIEHPYYCNLGNYFDNNCGNEYESWADFAAEEGDSDFDMNLLFRFDWLEADPEERHWGNEEEELRLFWIGQRKGLYRFTQIKVTKADEPAVREWLQKRLDYLLELWLPLQMQRS